jgi:hypothetical protein
VKDPTHPRTTGATSVEDELALLSDTPSSPPTAAFDLTRLLIVESPGDAPFEPRQLATAARSVTAAIDPHMDRLPPSLHGGVQNILEHTARLSDHQRANAYAILDVLYHAQGQAQFKRTTIRRVVHRQTQRWCQPVRRRTSVAVERPRSRAARPRARALARSSSRSGDSGSDDPSGEPPDDPPDSPSPSSDPGRRFCAWSPCGADISHMGATAKFCSTKHRVNMHRHPDGNGDEANPYYTLRPWELDALKQRVAEACRCNGHHVLDAENGDCIKCGRPYKGPDIPPYYEYVELWEQPLALRSYIRAVSYDREHWVAA